MSTRNLVGIIILLSFTALPLAGQTISGSISGTILDPQGAVVPLASVTARNVEQSTSVSTTTDNAGNFVFPQLLPATYALTIEKAGFKKFEQRNVVLNANTNVSVGNITLQVGAVAQTVEVVAQGAQLQTETAEHGTSIVGTQLQNIQVNGRSYLALLKLIPGVYTDRAFDLNTNELGNIFVNGSRGNQQSLTLNGVYNTDSGANSRMLVTVSLDSVQELKVLTSNYDASYGRTAGAQIMVVTRGGGRDIHGSGYWYYRDKGMNANSWFNNRDGQPKPLYHFNYLGYTVGGPIYIPGKFNTAKDKLFFFWSEEYQRQLTPRDQNGNTRFTTTLPTALERTGDFSQSVDNSGNPFPYIADYSTNLPCHGPTTNPPAPADTRGCFADGGVLGKIPASRLYGPGMALLNLFPVPKDAGPKGIINNYIFQPSGSVPRHEQTLRIDYNLSPKTRLYGSFIHLAEDVVSINASASGYSLSPNFPITPADFYHPGYLFNLNVTRILSPNMTNEAQVGVNHHPATVLPHNPQALTAAATGIDLPTLFTPFAGWIPDFNFGGSRISGSPQLRYNGAGGAYSPFISHNAVIDAVDNLTIVHGKHVIKTGIYVHRNRKDQTAFVPTEGIYNWGDSSGNPFNTGFGFANAATGVFTSFTQANRPANGEYRFTNLEFYGQDSWKVTPRFTFNYGVRAYWIQPEFDKLLQTSNFLPNNWNPGQAPRLYFPSCANPSCSSKVGIDLATGQTTPAVNIGAIVPNSGNLTDGILLAGKDLSKYLIQSPGILLGPRVGLAYDLTGRGNLVFRAGGGVYFDRPWGNTIFDLLANPPTIFTPTVFNGFAQNISLNNSLLFPGGITGISYAGNFPTTYNYSAGIQARLPSAMVVDVAYVGSLSRHLQDNLPLNPVPFGADFLQQNQDRTKFSGGAVPPPPYSGSQAYDANYLRPYPGYGGITLHEFSSTSNYNSLQVKLDRRFAKGLFLGVAYTWSKCMDEGDDEGTSHRIDGFNRLANYGPCGFDLRQNLIFNYVYALPGASSLGSLNNRLTRAAFNGWQLSGTTQLRNGTAAAAPSFSVPGVSNSTNLTGSPDFSARIKLIGNPSLATTDSPYNRLNPAAFAPASVGSIGLESSRNFLQNPGVNDWDMSLERNVHLTERAHLEFRVDAFNVFNHTQFSGINSGINFRSLADPTVTNLPYDHGNLVNKNGFGTVNGVRPARILQTVVRLVF